MNLYRVNTREVLIIGDGKIPKNEVAQIVKELAVFAGTTTYSVMPLSDDHALPTSVMTEIVNHADPDDSAFILYQRSWPDHGEWNSYQWDHSYLREHEDDDFIVLWLLGDEPVQVEVDFAHNVLDADKTLLIMNEGLWQVDRIDETGMYERVAPEPVPNNTAVTVPSVVQSIDEVNPVELARVEPNIEHLPEPNMVKLDRETGEVVKIDSVDNIQQPLTALPTNGDPEAVHPSQEKPPVLTVAQQIADPVPEPTATPYDRMGRAELKALVEERGVKADKRSVDLMIAALVADDQNGESSPTLDEVFEAVAVAEGKAAPNDHDPLTDAEQQALLADTMEAAKPALTRAIANEVMPPTYEEQQREAGSKLAALAERIGEPSGSRERLGIMMGQLELMAEHHRDLALLTAQLADVLLAVMQSDD